MSSTVLKTNNSDKGEKVRPAAVAGSFYEKDKDLLYKNLKAFFDKHTNLSGSNFSAVKETAAIIVPHAGYIFSGNVAASVYSRINPETKYKNIFLIGPSHHTSVNGASVNNSYDYYETPLGKVKVNKKICDRLINEYACFTYKPEAHNQEHCLEVQLPFLQYIMKEVPPIVPVIIGTQSAKTICEIAKALLTYFNKDNLFIISSDFSHYPNYYDACKADTHTGKGILKGSAIAFLNTISDNNRAGYKNLYTSACGECGILTLLYMTEQSKGISIENTIYENSGDSPYGEHNQVVGYNGFIIYRNKEKNYSKNYKEIQNTNTSKGEFYLSPSEKQTLLNIARQTINDTLYKKINIKPYKPQDITDTLKAHCGAFVTLYYKGNLRGCIGHITGDYPLYLTIQKMATAAAFEDPRFLPLSLNEWENIRLEISVLTPLEKIDNAEEFIPGKHGILISKNGRSGTFLPQVADEVNWTKEELLGHCSRDKAGLGWDGWKTADLYIYEAVIIKE